MAALDFPAAPTVGQVFNAWTFDGIKWDLTGGGSAGSDGYTFMQDTQPTATAVGQTWYDTSIGQSFVWYDGFWVQTSSGSSGSGVSDPVIGEWTVGSMALSTTVDTVLVVSPAVTLLAGRRYLMLAQYRALTGNANGVAWKVSDSVGPTELFDAWANRYATSGFAGSHSMQKMITGDGASHVFTMNMNAAGGGAGGTVYSPKLLLIDLSAASGGALTVTPWTALPLASGWVNFGGGNQPAEYRKVGDDVQLRGLVKRASTSVAAGVASDIGNLPIGFRAPTHLIHTVVSKPSASVALQGVLVQQLVTGAVQYYAETTGAGLGTDGWVTLTGINFSVTP